MSYQSRDKSNGSLSPSREEQQQPTALRTRSQSVIDEQQLENFLQQGVAAVNEMLQSAQRAAQMEKAMAERAMQLELAKMNVRLEALKKADGDELDQAVTEIQSGCGNPGLITAENLFYQKLLLELNGVEVLLGFLQKHKSKHNCSGKVAATLGILSNEKSPLRDKFTEEFHNGLGIPYLVSCLEDPGDERLFVENVLVTLCNILKYSKVRTKDEFVKAKGIELSTKVMKLHEKYRLCRVAAVVIFEALSDDPANRRLIFDVGIVETLLDEFTCGNFYDIARAANLLNSIAKDSQEHQDYIRRVLGPSGTMAIKSMYNAVINMLLHQVGFERDLIHSMTMILRSCDSLVKILSKPERNCCSCCCQSCCSNEVNSAVVSAEALEDIDRPKPWCTRLYGCFGKVCDACGDFADRLPDILEDKSIRALEQFSLRVIP